MHNGRAPHYGRDGTGRHETPSIDELARDIAERLRPVCTHCDEQEFAMLVRRIATVELKYKLAGESGGDGAGRQTIPGA